MNSFCWAVPTSNPETDIAVIRIITLCGREDRDIGRSNDPIITLIILTTY